jgi:1-acyl-sn-glycerol-3-phosphate acyltransferase
MRFTLRLIRKILGWIDFVVFTIVLYLLAWIPLRGKGPVAWMFRAWCRSFVRAIDIDLRLHQKYRGNMPQRFILIANHPGALEDIGIPSLFNVVSLAKSQVRDWFMVGRINYAAGTLFVDRDDADSRQHARQEMIDAVNAGKNIALYPEGGCKGRRLYSEFKSGAFDVSIHTGIPILPVFVHCEAQEDFEWQSPYTLPQKIWHMAKSVNDRVNFYVHDPLDPKDYADKHAMRDAAYALYTEWNKKYLE